MSLKGITRPTGRTPVTNPGQHSPLALQNRVLMDVVGPDGVVKQHVEHDGNLMVTHGLVRLGEMLVSDSDGASAWVSAGAIGTDTTAVGFSNDSLGNSTQIVHLSQASMVGSDAGNMTSEWQMTFASDGQASQIHEIGLFATNNATEKMIARSVLGVNSVNRGSADEIRATYQVILKSCA